MTFDGYVVGRGNLLAHAAARHVVDGARATLNPLFLHGEQGRGKTRLLQAMANALESLGRPVLFLSGCDFPRIVGVAHRFEAMFVDDVGAVHGKSQRVNFAHALAAMADAGRQVVLASAASPAGLDFEPDGEAMRRIRGGTVVEIGAMDREQRFALLGARAGAMAAEAGVPCPDEALLRTVADRVAGSARDLLAVLQSVMAATLATGACPEGSELDGLMARAVDGTADVPIERIQTVVAEFFGVSRDALISRGRMAEVVTPRQVAMYLAKEINRMSLPEIGRGFGGRDHTTVLHAVRKISRGLVRSPHLADQVDRLRRKLRER
jgi:chromosomal replication initiator protein